MDIQRLFELICEFVSTKSHDNQPTRERERERGKEKAGKQISSHSYTIKAPQRPVIG